MNPQNNRLRVFAAWCGIAYVALVFGGFGLVGRLLLPPHKPSAGPEKIAEFFQENTTSVRVGMVIVMVAALVSIPYSAIIASLLREVDKSRFLAYSALLGGAGLMVLTFYPAIFWLIAAYRPERSPDLILLMNDLGWLQFIGGITIFLALPIGCAIAAFIDQRPDPVFPRWFGYYNAWVIVLMIPDQLMFFFHSGPFAWNGIFGLWLPASVFGSWFYVTVYLMLRSFKKEARESAAVDPAAGAEGRDDRAVGAMA